MFFLSPVLWRNKSKRIIVKLVSAAQTGYYYVIAIDGKDAFRNARFTSEHTSSVQKLAPSEQAFEQFVFTATVVVLAFRGKLEMAGRLVG